MTCDLTKNASDIENLSQMRLTGDLIPLPVQSIQ